MAMSAPFVLAWTKGLTQWGIADSKAWLSVGFIGTLLVFPLIVFPLCGAIARWFSQGPFSGMETATRLIPGLVPLGFAMWAAHLGFHLATGVWTGWPAVQRALHDLFPKILGAPESFAAARWTGLVDAQLLVLGAGLVVSVAVLWRIGREILPEPGRALGLVIPWFVLAIGLWGLGVVIFLAPMQMRGTLM